MNKIDEIIKFSIYFLLFWYVISPFIWINDDTLSFDLKICYSIINYMVLASLTRVIVFEYKSPNYMDFSSVLMLIGWFFYSTSRDFSEAGYYFLLKLFYISIDLLSMVFLIDTFINFLLNSKLFIFSSNEMTKINRTMKFILAGIFSFIYCHIYRQLK